jgi:hypothetical protein
LGEIAGLSARRAVGQINLERYLRPVAALIGGSRSGENAFSKAVAEDRTHEVEGKEE